MKGRLNLFQASMLRWRELAPYNAVHIVRVAELLDPARLAAAIEGELGACGLEGFELDAATRHYRYAGGHAPVALPVYPAAPDGAETLRATVERELNAAFPADGRFDPFRFFAVADGGSFHLGLAYDHLVAGGDSISAFLGDVVDRYQGRVRGAPAAARLDAYPPTYDRLFSRHLGALLRGLRRLPAIAASCRRGYRPRYADSRDGRNGFVHVHVGAAEFLAMRRAAKSWDVTPNDLLLALLLQALSPFAAERRGESRRKELAVASIVNIRRDYQSGVGAVFGQFLSSFRVSHPVPDGIGLEALARDISAETQRIKRGKLYLQTLLGVAAGAMIWRFQSPLQRSRIHAKSYPVWAGITLLDADALWQAGAAAGSAASPAPAYLRGVSTGPLAPIVVAATIAGGGLSLGLSFRTTAFSREFIDNLASDLLRQIRKLAP
jgi:hypothetical protein